MQDETQNPSTEGDSSAGADNPTLDEKRKRAQEQRTQVVADASQVNTLTPEPGQDVGESQVQEVIDAENEAGFRGIKMDPTPNENYSATNSAAGNDLPTPETDQDLRREAAANRQVDGPVPYH